MKKNFAPRRLILSAGLLLFLSQAEAQSPGSPCDSLTNISLKLIQQKNYKSAIDPLEHALRLCSNDKQMTDLDYYYLLAVLSISYYEAGMEDSSIVSGEAAASWFEKSAKTSDPMYHGVVGRLGLAYSFKGDYRNAIFNFEKTIPFYESKYGTSNQFYIWYGLELARCYSALSEFDKAQALNRKLREAIIASAGKNSTMYISVLTNIGNDFLRLSVFDSAMVYHTEGLALREQVLGKKSHEYGKGLGILAQVYSDQNRFADAILLYEQGRGIYLESGQGSGLEFATLLNSLGLCYNNLSIYDKALVHLTESLRIKKKIFGDYHPDVAAGINNIATVWENNFQYAEAIRAYRYAKLILERTSGTENQQYASVLSNLGGCYASTTRLDSAAIFLQEALTLKEKLFGPANYAIASTLNSLAEVRGELKEFNEAEQLYKRSMSIVENTFGRNSYRLSTLNENLALLYRQKGAMDKADSLLQLAYEITKSFILENTEGLSEADKEGFAQSIRLDNYVALDLRQKHILPNAWLYNSSLFYKGLLLEGSRGLRTALSQLKDPALQEKAREYIRLKEFIGRQLLQPLAGRSGELPEAINRSESYERELLQASSGFRNWKQNFNTEWKQLQKGLKKDEAIIEFVAYYPVGISRTDSTRYVAMIIKAQSNDPVTVPLFYEVDFNKLLSKTSGNEAVVKKLYRSTINSSTKQPTASDSLYHLIWKPLLPHLEGIRSIHFAADGVINNLNLAAIITPGSQRLIELYELNQYSSTRNLANPSAQPAFKSIQLWGGIDYNSTTSASSKRNGAFSYLPGTLEEIEQVEASAGRSAGKTKKFISSEANESAFKMLDGNSTEVLHIATHGFFFPEPSLLKNKSENRFAQAENPLLRSGLALAGANHSWQEGLASSDKEDGVLTAYEIADLDLSGTRLVVLSACETGLGDIKSGEGVYGLQRAFKMAGVDYLVMSLWQVPDLETKEFMQTFYKHCFSGVPVRKAFRETQLMMNKKYQPYQWAAFVLVE